MTTVKDVNATEFVTVLKDELKNVKTGVGKQRPPEQEDWWFIRTAAVLRKVYIQGPIGTSRLRKKFSTSKKNGHRPSHSSNAGGAIIRNTLKQLESAQLLKKNEITVFDATGMAIHDIAVAKLVYEKCKKKGLGKEIDIMS